MSRQTMLVTAGIEVEVFAFVLRNPLPELFAVEMLVLEATFIVLVVVVVAAEKQSQK